MAIDPRCFPAARLLLALAVIAGIPALTLAQNNGQQQVAGISIDAAGVVSPVFSKAKSGKLEAKRLQAAAADALPADLNTTSAMRKVSLVKLEQAFEPYAANPDNVPAEMKYLAGLQRIDYVFVYPEEGDLVVAGPAEGFAEDSSGRVVGVDSGRPPVRLDDLIVALRTAAAGERLGCSIDPVPQSLADMIRFINQNSNATTPATAAARYRRMADILGTQNIRVWGVPPDSHFAYALVEADYRMKLVSMELERANVRGFRSHLSMLAPTGNSLQRWWFTPLYDAFYQSEDGLAFEFAGQRAQLSAQEEITNAGGQRANAPQTRISTHKYAQHFTEKFPELADASPVFAELQNLIDLAVLGALLNKEDLPHEVNWPMSLFLDRQRTVLPTGHPPKQVASVVNYRRVNRGMIIGLMGGGVVVNPVETIDRVGIEVDASRRLGGLRDIAIKTEPPPEHIWWWD